MKTYKTQLRELQAELRHWQGQVRLELRWVKESKEKVREIGRKMRTLQNENRKLMLGATLLSKEEFNLLSKDKPTIIRGVVCVPSQRMGEFSGFFIYGTNYFTQEQLSTFLNYPGANHETTNKS